MDRRLALFAVWVAFAVAAVGVGFGAAGLVGEPFTDGVTDAAPASDVSTGPGETPGPGGSTPAGERSISPSSDEPSRTSSPAGTRSATPTRTRSLESTASGTRSATATASRTGTGGSTAEQRRSVTRSITTRAGLASATCTGSSARLSASPAVGWQIEDIDAGPADRVRVRFEPRGDGDDRVEVDATCVRGTPQFSLDDEGGAGGGDGGDDGGGHGD